MSVRAYGFAGGKRSLTALSALFLPLLVLGCAHEPAGSAKLSQVQCAAIPTKSEYPTVEPNITDIDTGASMTFLAHEMKQATWRLDERQPLGQISTGGTYIAPAVPGWYWIYAVDACDPHRCAAARINVHPHGAPSSIGLIYKAKAEGKLTDDMAFVYSVFAETLDPRLPVWLRGNDSGFWEENTIKYGLEQFKKLPPRERELVAPYFPYGAEPDFRTDAISPCDLRRSGAH